MHKILQWKRKIKERKVKLGKMAKKQKNAIKESPHEIFHSSLRQPVTKRDEQMASRRKEREGCKRGPLQYSTAPLSGISFFSLASTERRFHLNKGPARPPSPSLGLYTDVGRWEQETLVLMRPWTTDWSECSRFAELRQTNKPFTYFPFGLLPMRGARK